MASARRTVRLRSITFETTVHVRGDQNREPVQRAIVIRSGNAGRTHRTHHEHPSRHCHLHSGPKPRSFRVAVASIVGSIIEQYDFLVTGVIAATVWGGIFFKDKGLAAVAGAISIYGLGILIRPIGAFIFGHIADRRGRKVLAL